MSEPKHTPGPWVALPCKQTPDRGAVFVEGPGGWDRDPVCSTYEHYEREVNEANAHLIAAAPDLLAVCRLMLRDVGDGGPGTHDYVSMYTVERIRAAIAKAEGRPDA